MKPRSLLLPTILVLLFLAGGTLRGQDLGEGSEMEVGGPGAGKGKFDQVMDITFDAKNRLYVLDGVRPEKDGLVGNGLVQKFDNDGRFLGEFSVIDKKLGDKNDPACLAVDGGGHVFITVPRAGLVQEYDADGKRVRSIAIPAAYAIATRTFGGKEQIVVVPAVNPAHWAWKLGELRKIMAKHGDQSKPIWQTERAIGGVRAENFIGGVQAVRVLLHRDVLETLGIPNEHNLHYYLNEAR